MKLSNREEQVYKLSKEGLSRREISDRTGLTMKSISNYRYNIKKKMKDLEREISREIDNYQDAQGKESFYTDTRGDSMSISSKSTRIKTVEQALEKAEVDLSIWEVDRVQVNSWEVGRKNIQSNIEYNGKEKFGTEKDSGKFNVQELWQVKVWLKKKTRSILKEALESLTRELRNNPVSIYNKAPEKSSYRDHLLEVSLFDFHFAKQCVNGEGLEFSRELYPKTIETILNRVQREKIERILLPIGNDFFHVNGFNKTTQKGTPQDLDGDFFTMYKEGCASVLEGINLLRSVAPVDVIWVPGNHDFETSFFLCSYLDAFFHKDVYIDIDTRPIPRKYYHYGVNLLGFTHGNEEAHRDLPSIMMYENKESLKGKETFEWHIGHKHKKNETRFNAGVTHGNVYIRVLPSLCGTDYWHFKKGYVGGQRTSESYLWSKEFGYSSHISSSLKEIKK